MFEGLIKNIINKREKILEEQKQYEYLQKRVMEMYKNRKKNVDTDKYKKQYFFDFKM